MKDMEKIFIYFAGINIDPALPPIVKDIFTTKPSVGISYKDTRLLIEFFEDKNNINERRPSKAEALAECFNRFIPVAASTSNRATICVLVRLEVEKDQFFDCLMYRPANEGNFQLAYEKGLDGNDPSRFNLTENQKELFHQFMAKGITYIEADNEAWKESISTVVRYEIANVVPHDSYVKLCHRNSLF